MEQSFFEWIIQQTGLAAVAVLALIMLNAVWKRAYGDAREMWTETLSALKANTAVVTKLTEKLDN